MSKSKNMHDMAREVEQFNERSCNAYGVLSPSDKKKVK